MYPGKLGIDRVDESERIDERLSILTFIMKVGGFAQLHSYLGIPWEIEKKSYSLFRK